MTEWEDDGPLDKGLQAIIGDVRVTAGKGPEGIWVKVSGPPESVMSTLTTALQDHAQLVLGEHLG